MGKLSILGAQRVKALIQVLNDKEKEEIAKVNEGRISRKDAEKVVNEQLGVQGIFEEIESIKERLKEINKTLSNKTGHTFSFESSLRTWSNPVASEYSSKVSEIQENGTDEKIAEIKSEYRQKEQMLWLCEALEDAKRIVGLD